MAVKKPRIRFRVRGFWCLRLVQLRRALTRTSVGNEKYEYERKERDPARADASNHRYDPVVGGLAAGAVAVRHNSTLTEAFGRVNRFFGIWRRIATVPHQTTVRKARRPDAFAANGCKCNYFHSPA